MKYLYTFIHIIRDSYDLCVEASNILFDPSDRCMLHIHMFQLLLDWLHMLKLLLQ